METQTIKEFIKTHKAELISSGLIIAATGLLIGAYIATSRTAQFRLGVINRMIEVAKDLDVLEKLNAHENLMMSQGR